MPPIKPPKSFPGMDTLPSPLKGLTEFIFPAEPQLPAPPIMAVTTGRAVEAVSPAVSKLLQLLKNEPAPKNLDAAVEAARATPHRAYGPTQLEVPKGFELPQGVSPWIKRAPKIHEAHAAQRAFDARNRLASPMGTPSPFRPRPATAYRGKSTASLTAQPKAPSIQSVDDLLDITSNVGDDVVTPIPSKPAISPAVKHVSMRKPGPTGTIPKGKLPPDLVEQVQRTAGTGRKSLQDIEKMFPQLTNETLRYIIQKLPWTWKP